MLIPTEFLPAVNQPGTPKNVETRGLSDLPGIIALTERMAGICFRQIGGRIDYTGFFGDDPTFHYWVKDLFLHYWDKGTTTLNPR
jgi:predicted transcriptional regulator